MEHVFIAPIFSGSIWQIIGQSSAFGIFILLILVFMSLVSWAIIVNKWRLFRTVEAASNRFLENFRRSRRLNESVSMIPSVNESPLAGMYKAGLDEMNDLTERKNQGGGLQDKKHRLDDEDFDIVEMAMSRSQVLELGQLERQVIFLAATASAAPFMGLLGTVVGIMDSFWSIGERGSASLAVVAPGIAEALLATIVGLAAAIPAVIAYNWANNKMKFLTDSADNFVLEFLARARKEERA